MTQSPLLHDVLRLHSVDSFDRRLVMPYHQPDKEDPDDELINVLSLPGTPALSRAPSRPTTRPPSPTKGASSRPGPRPLHIVARRTDPLKAVPTEIGQRIFGLLSVQDLARCARVSKKWSRSQTINYVWFQHYRKENFQDDSLPPGKWTRRESKQNWRTTFIKSLAETNRSPTMGPMQHYAGSSPPSGSNSGYQTPQEIREEKWRVENESSFRPSKQEMRDIYKEMGGRKARGKGKITAGGIRDRGGWDANENDL